MPLAPAPSHTAFVHEFDPVPSRTRVVELENGNKLNLTAKDPYGFIYLSLEHGPLPESFRGAYTSWHHAEMAAQSYVRLRQDTLAEIKEKDATVGAATAGRKAK